MNRLCGRRFRAGGFVLNVPGTGAAPANRVLMFSRQLNRPHQEIVFDTIGPSNQAAALSATNVEVLLNGGHIFNETLRFGVWEYDLFLSWLRVPAYGLLQVYMTNGDAGVSDLGIMIEGFYEDPRGWA